MCVTKLCVSKLCVCVTKLCVSKLCVRERGGGGGAGYRIKNKNPTQRCGELLDIARAKQ